MSTSTQLPPIQAAAAIALGFGLNLSAVAAKFDIHRSTIHNWMKVPEFLQAVQTAQAEFQTQFRTELAILTHRALETVQEILASPEASPAVRLKAALAVLKQDWKLPHSTDFDTFSQTGASLRNEMPPETEPGPFDTFRHPATNEINDVRNEMAPEPTARPQPVHRRKVGRNVPCPCGSNLKYKRCCGK
ncbi:MAG: SEC-C domain-containing protein [Bryobacterales bacterium]|nr:SEC-C domain-containing protein [Bryobacterales bacterium]